MSNVLLFLHLVTLASGVIALVVWFTLFTTMGVTREYNVQQFARVTVWLTFSYFATFLFYALWSYTV